jgi:hypothetical protein
MPTQYRLGLNESAQRRTRDQAVEGGHDQPVGGRQLRPIDLPAQDPELVAQEEYFGLGTTDSQPDVGYV